ncbi:MAG TPA: polysaccharide biosynthesis protein, partial [Roseococcus sp.]|nr:polysaccharide biosynthesis protein [Roseococcus sp.]
MALTAPFRILLNLSLDAALAMLALPLAIWLAAPGNWPLPGWWLVAWPLALLALIGPAWALGLPKQYWRYAGVQDLLALLGAALAAAVLFSLSLRVLGLWKPPSAAFPALHAMALGGLLGVPRLVGRLRMLRRPLGRHAEEGEQQPVLVVGGV